MTATQTSADVYKRQVRETVAMETLAKRAIVRISIRSGISSESGFFGVIRSAKGVTWKSFSSEINSKTV